METWSAGLFDDVIAQDVIDLYRTVLNEGGSPDQAAEEVVEEHRESLDDADEGPIVLLALASLLLDSGVKQHLVLDEAREILREKIGLEYWKDIGKEALAEREEVYRLLEERLR